MSVSNFRQKAKEAKKVFHLTMRGMGIMWREAKRYTIIGYVNTLLEICKPYWGIWFSARILDAILDGEELSVLVTYIALLIGGELLIGMIQSSMSCMISQDEFIFSQTEQMIWGKKVLSMDYSSLEDEKIHMLHQRVVRESFNDGKNLRLLRWTMPRLVGSIISVGIAIFMAKEFLLTLAKESGWFFLVIAGGFILSVFVSSKCSAATEASFLKCNQKISQNCVQRDGYSAYLNNYERGKEIRIFQLGKLLMERMMEAHRFNDKALDARNKDVLCLAGLSEFASGISYLIIQCLTVLMALAGKITIGNMTQCINSINQFVNSVKAVWSALVTLWYNGEYLERYFTFMDIKSEMKKGCIPVEKRLDGEYEVVFDNVSFRYPGSDRYALENLNLKFKIGEKMAVVGMNGSGKSTFIKLLCRLYDPTEGTIYMNGIDIKRYNYEEYLSLFSVVFQDFKLFSFGLGENVSVSERYETNEIVKILEKAGLSEFLEKQKYGLITTLYRDFDSEGVEVSGGEAQKIALARAICKGAPFVLLDEPTAALDPMAEYEIYKRFNDLVADRTTVYISHRMSSCRFCDDIVVFDAGRMVQRGSHDKLIEETNGKYYELWTAQSQYYLEANA